MVHMRPKLFADLNAEFLVYIRASPKAASTLDTNYSLASS